MTLRERFERLYASVVYDAMAFDLKHRHPFVVHHAIRPVWPMRSHPVMFGPAFTCKGERVRDPEHVDDTVRLRMFDSFMPGCVQVIDTDGDGTVAHFGDISGKLARRAGACGAVVDGFTRDARIHEEDRFPIFARGVQPIDAFGRWQLVAYQVPVWLDGIEGRVPVHPGDYVFADPDGVLLIPESLGHRVCEAAEARLEREDEVRQRLVSGTDVMDLHAALGRW